MCTRRVTWKHGLFLIALILPSTLLYMSYYWPDDGQSLRFLLPTLCLYPIAAVWLLRELSAAKAASAWVGSAVLLLLTAAGDLPTSTYLLQQVAGHVGAGPEECFFWATHSGAELDLLWVRGRRRWGFEFKRTSSPKLTSSLHTTVETLRLQRAFLVHAGDKTFPLHKRVTAVAAARLLEDVG